MSGCGKWLEWIAVTTVVSVRGYVCTSMWEEAVVRFCGQWLMCESMALVYGEYLL